MNTDAERRELRALAQAGDLDGMQQLLGKTPEQKAAEQAALCKAARDKNLAEVGDQRAVAGRREAVTRRSRNLDAGFRPIDEGVAGVRRGRHHDRCAVRVDAAARDRAARGRVGADGDGIGCEGFIRSAVARTGGGERARDATLIAADRGSAAVGFVGDDVPRRAACQERARPGGAAIVL